MRATAALATSVMYALSAAREDDRHRAVFDHFVEALGIERLNHVRAELGGSARAVCLHFERLRLGKIDRENLRDDWNAVLVVSVDIRRRLLDAFGVVFANTTS